MTPNPEKAWAVYDEKGNMIAHRKKRWVVVTLVVLDEQARNWKQLYKRGYRCHKVKIVVVR